MLEADVADGGAGAVVDAGVEVDTDADDPDDADAAATARLQLPVPFLDLFLASEQRTTRLNCDTGTGEGVTRIERVLKRKKRKKNTEIGDGTMSTKPRDTDLTMAADDSCQNRAGYLWIETEELPTIYIYIYMFVQIYMS